MASLLPYLASPGSIKTALDKIRSAAVPERVTGDFVQTKLAIKGGTGSAIAPFLKRIGLVASDGKPTDLYREFRNASQGGRAIAEAIKIGYKPLGEVNETSTSWTTASCSTSSCKSPARRRPHLRRNSPSPPSRR